MIYRSLVVIFVVCASYMGYLAFKPQVIRSSGEVTFECKVNAPTCDVYFSDTIEAPDRYFALYQYIDESRGTTLYFHLEGSGGRTATIIKLYNVIKLNETKVISIVEGPVYSAHAFLAMLGEEIRISPSSLFMFHEAAAYNSLTKQYIKPIEMCETFRGQLDRGQDAYKKCVDMVNAESKSMNNMLKRTVFKYLTPEETAKFNEGYDIYISGEEMISRTSK